MPILISIHQFDFRLDERILNFPAWIDRCPCFLPLSQQFTVSLSHQQIRLLLGAFWNFLPCFAPPGDFLYLPRFRANGQVGHFLSQRKLGVLRFARISGNFAIQFCRRVRSWQNTRVLWVKS